MTATSATETIEEGTTAVGTAIVKTVALPIHATNVAEKVKLKD
jgi:hypothetical protein